MPRGGKREGAGRPPLPPQARVGDERLSITLPADLAAHARKQGNVSAYLRRLIAADRARNSPPSPPAP